MSRFVVVPLIVLALAAPLLHAQGVETAESIVVRAGDSTLLLGHELVVPGSVALTLDSVYHLQPALDYSVDERFGVVRLTPFFGRLLNDTSHAHVIAVVYHYRAIRLPREYFRRRLVTITDSSGAREVAVARTGAGSIFGNNFQQSGGIVRGFTVGSNRDLSLQSRLWLQFSGKITDDVEVLGAVTDEQTPIQPEGNTQTLREVDNIFIEFRSPYVGGTIGKFTAASRANEWTAFSRKLQGVRAIGRYGRYGTTEIIAAVSPGRFRTMQMSGRERDQGPYRLTGSSGERNILVVAGTERVFIDGVQMVRGEGNDYVIDYSTGEIFFQTRRLITSASRISVDFEYSDRQYSRSFISVANAGYLFDSTLTLMAGYLREADNPDATIDITLSEGDRALLASAGTDRFRAVRSGAVFVGRGDTVVGLYYRRDTLIDGRPDSVFVYAPNDPRSVYAVSFTVAADGRGDYRSVAFGQYEYVGHGLGSYLPVVYLPMPQLRQIFSIGAQARPSAGITAMADVALSDASLNRFSVDPSANDRGVAFSANIAGAFDTLDVGGMSLGSVRLNGNARFVAAGFKPIERVGDVEFSNRWNAASRIGESGMDDFIAEGSLLWRPAPRLDIAGSAGLLRRGSLFNSLRQQYSARYLGDTSLPAADYTFELITTRDTLSGHAHGSWLKQRGGVSYSVGAWTPAIRAEYEWRQDRASAGTDTLAPGSFRFLDIGPEIRLDLPWLGAKAGARYRVDDSVHVGRGTFLRDGASTTLSLHGESRGLRDVSSTLDLSLRRKTYDSIPGVDMRGRLENQTILARSQTRWSGFDRAVDLDALYDVQTEQAARLQRVYVRVPYGQGQYRWQDLDSNGVQEEFEFIEAFAGEGEYVRFEIPTETLFPVIDLRSSLRLRLQPKRLLSDGTAVARLLGPISTETYLRVEEKSQTTRESDIYLLRFDRFQDDSTTIAGTSIVQQDVLLWEGDPEFSARLRYQDRRGLTRFVGRIERRLDLERSLRLRWQPVTAVGLQLDLISSGDLLTSNDTLYSREFDMTGMTAISDFSYRPEQSLELGWKLRVTSSEDVLPLQPRRTLMSTNELRAEYAIETRGRLRASVERTSVGGENLGGGEIALPYELTEGYAVGATWIGRLTFEYRFGSNIQASITWTGRAQPPTDRVIHTGQAEVRAFF